MMLQILAAAGLTFGILYSPLFKWLRESSLVQDSEKLRYFFSCPQCLGFWCGLLFGIVYSKPVISAFATSFLCFIVHRLLLYADVKRQVEEVIRELYD